MALDRKTWMSIFISAVMILSVIGFSLTMTEPEQQVEYNGMKFTRSQAGWQAKINNVKTELYYYPAELEDIPVDEGVGVALDGIRVLWFSYNPADTYAQEIAGTLFYMEDLLAKVKDVYVQRGLLNNTDYALPEATCANATLAVPVLVLQSGNETSVRHDNGCIIATASSGRDISMVGDRVLYQAFGVMR
ncbi:MAG: hypothetical protein QXM31_04025 [Candidatus Woesearchaeota archaeon]